MRKWGKYFALIILCLSTISINITALAEKNNGSIIETNKVDNGVIMTVMESGVNIRSNAGINYTSLGLLNRGEKVFVSKESATYKDGYCWRYVKRLSNMTEGWVVSSYLG